MLNIELYAISVIVNGEELETVEYFYSFNDAMAARINSSSWWCIGDDVYIKRLRKDGVCAIEEWHISKDGNIIGYWNYNNLPDC